MANSPRVSVTIPTYNFGHLLDDAIQSVLSQTFTDYELIVIDNASKDNTEEVVAKYLHDPRVRYYRNATNIGMAGNWNKCLESGEGEFVKLLCADDKMHPQMLEKYVRVMDENPSVAIVAAHKEWFGEKVPPKVRKLPVEGLVSGRAAIATMIEHNLNIIGEPSIPMMRRTSVMDERFSELSFTTDWEMWVRVLHRGDCYIVPEVLSYNRRHAGQQQVLMRKAGISNLEYYHLFNDIKTNKYPYSFPELREELDRLTRVFATNCAFQLYRLLPRAYAKSTRETLRRLGGVAVKEGTLIGPGVMRVLFRKIGHKVPFKGKQPDSESYVTAKD